MNQIKMSPFLPTLALLGCAACGPSEQSPPPVAPSEAEYPAEDASPGASDRGPGASEPSSEPGAQAPPPRAATGAEPTDDEVQSFARAYLAVVQIEQEYAQELGPQPTAEEVEAVQQQATQDMQQVIATEGLTVGEFEQIGQMAAEDAELRQRIQAEIEGLANAPANAPASGEAGPPVAPESP